VGKIAEKNSPYECIFDNIALYFEFPEFKKTHSFRLFFWRFIYNCRLKLGNIFILTMKLNKN